MVNGRDLTVILFFPETMLAPTGKTPKALSSHHSPGLAWTSRPLTKTRKSPGRSTTALTSEKSPASPLIARNQKTASKPEFAGNLSRSRMFVLYWTALSQGFRPSP